MDKPNRSSVRRSRKARVCDGCRCAIERGRSYFAAHGADGPHEGWWYFCVPCAEHEGWMAPVARREGVTQ